MRLSKKLGIVGLTACLSACGGGVQDFVDVVNAIPSVIPPPTTTRPGPGGNVPPPSSQAPNYAANGFVANESNSLNLVTVLETTPANNNVTQNYSKGPATNLRISYSPSTGILSIFSQAPAFDGTSDPESARLVSTGGPDFSSGQGNNGWVRAGNYAWSVNAQYDENDGRFRHNLAAAGGQRFTPPASGGATYTAVMDGIIEQFSSSGSRTVPYLARGNVNVSFANGSVTSTFDIDPAISNNVVSGRIGANANLSSNAGFRGPSTAQITLDGRSAVVSGEILGGVAGPNAQEVFGIVSLGSSSGSPVATTIDGAFFGFDRNR